MVVKHWRRHYSGKTTQCWWSFVIDPLRCANWPPFSSLPPDRWWCLWSTFDRSAFDFPTHWPERKEIHILDQKFRFEHLRNDDFTFLSKSSYSFRDTNFSLIDLSSFCSSASSLPLMTDWLGWEWWLAEAIVVPLFRAVRALLLLLATVADDWINLVALGLTAFTGLLPAIGGGIRSLVDCVVDVWPPLDKLVSFVSKESVDGARAWRKAGPAPEMLPLLTLLCPDKDELGVDDSVAAFAPNREGQKSPDIRYEAVSLVGELGVVVAVVDLLGNELVFGTPLPPCPPTLLASSDVLKLFLRISFFFSWVFFNSTIHGGTETGELVLAPCSEMESLRKWRRPPLPDELNVPLVAEASDESKFDRLWSSLSLEADKLLVNNMPWLLLPPSSSSPSRESWIIDGGLRSRGPRTLDAVRCVNFTDWWTSWRLWMWLRLLVLLALVNVEDALFSVVES